MKLAWDFFRPFKYSSLGNKYLLIILNIANKDINYNKTSARSGVNCTSYSQRPFL